MSQIRDLPWLEKPGGLDSRSARRRQLPFLGRTNLLRIPWIRALLYSRWPQFLVRSATLAGFVFSIAAGLFGSRVGSHNFAIIFVWIAWWTALKLVFIHLGGRSWCSVCPIPMPGEWLQQGGIFKRGPQRFGLNLRWPKRLKGTWMQSGGFLLIGLFSALTLTDPRVTAWVLLGLFGMAIGLSLVFEKRAFCAYICPIGGFTGIYAKTAPLELRVIDAAVCAAHSEKTCYQNCPWGQYPLALRDSAQCGLCMECLRVCPQDNIAVNLRPFGSDLGQPRQSKRLDEAFLALVMLGSALAFSAVFTGPWGGLKSAAFAIGSPAWMAYGLGLLAFNLGVMPGLFTLAVWLPHLPAGSNLAPRLPASRQGRNRRLDRRQGRGHKWSGSKTRQRPESPVPTGLRREIADKAQALLPLGLFAWIAFTISFAFPKFNYVLSVSSDPLGWGWNLFGTTNTSWSPDVTGFSSLLQIAILAIGLFWSANVALELAETDNKPAFRQALPILIFILLFSFAMLWLLVG